MPLPMPRKKRSSHLRELTETRANAAGEIRHYERILAEVQELLAIARSDLAACDRLIRKYDVRLDPTRIKPVRARTQYGGSGRLRKAIVQVLREVYPGNLTTSQIAIEIQLQFGIEFATPFERKRWFDNSLTRALRAMLRDGIVERLHNPRVNTGEAGRWRVRSSSGPSADHLLEQLVALGAPVDEPEEGSD